MYFSLNAIFPLALLRGHIIIFATLHFIFLTFMISNPFDSWMGIKPNELLPVCFFFSPQRSDGEGIVHLDGEGYAAVGRPTRWNPNISTVTFKFRTFSSEALLMYLATDDMVRFCHSERGL